MKKILPRLCVCLCLLLFPFYAFCQDSTAIPKPRKTGGFMLGLGPAMIAKNSRAYDAWIVKSGGKQNNADVGFAMEMALVRAKYDFGLYVAAVPDFGEWGFFLGRQVIQRGHFYDFLHLGFGELTLKNKYTVPYGYVPTADEIGKKMELSYEDFAMSLTSESIFTIRNKGGQDACYWGLNLRAGYMPGDGVWHYGYTEGYSNGKYSHGTFHGRSVPGAPNFGHTTFSASLIFGIGGPRIGTRHYKHYQS